MLWWNTCTILSVTMSSGTRCIASPLSNTFVFYKLGTAFYEHKETNFKKKRENLQCSCDSHWGVSENYFRVWKSCQSSTVVRTSWNRYLRWRGQAISVLLLRFIALGHEGFAFLKSIMKVRRVSQTRHCWRRPHVEVNTVGVMERGGVLMRLHWSWNLGLYLCKCLVVYLDTTGSFY